MKTTHTLQGYGKSSDYKTHKIDIVLPFRLNENDIVNFNGKEYRVIFCKVTLDIMGDINYQYEVRPQVISGEEIGYFEGWIEVD